MLTWQQFTSIPNGTRVLNHGWDQCVALANLYHESVIGGSFVAVGSAYQWWTEFGNWPTLRNNYTPSPTPAAGAIFVARYGIYDAPNGHIGVVTSVNSNGTFNTMEQNAGTWRYVGRYTRGMANIYGFLIPKNNPATPGKSSTAATPTNRQIIRNNERLETVLVFLNPARQDGSPAYAIYRPGVKGSWEEFDKNSAKGSYANALASQFGTPMEVTLNEWLRLQKKYR